MKNVHGEKFAKESEPPKTGVVLVNGKKGDLDIIEDDEHADFADSARIELFMQWKDKQDEQDILVCELLSIWIPVHMYLLYTYASVPECYAVLYCLF